MSGSSTLITPQQNYAARMALLTSNQRQRTPLSPVSGALGSTIRFNLNNTGITTGVRLLCSLTLTSTNLSATALTPQFQAPYNILSLVTARDYNSIARINATGPQLFNLANERLNHVLQRRAKGAYSGLANSAAIPDPSVTSSNVIGLPSLPVSVPPSGTATITFEVHIPFAYDDRADLRGAIFTQTSIGNITVQVNVITTLAGAVGTAPYAALPSGITAGSLTITPVQEWLSPQPVGGSYPNPQRDLFTVYEFAGGITDSSNLVAGQTKYVNVPNARDVLCTYLTYMNGTSVSPSGADVTSFSLIVNSNDTMQLWTPYTAALENRELIGSDLPPQEYRIRSREVPLQTSLQGNVQVGFVAATVNAGAYLMEGFESFYPLGAVLPGVAPA